MEILTLILKVCAILGLFTLMFLPLANVTGWDDDAWYARFVVSALATTAWVGFLVFVPGAIIACAVVWVLLIFVGFRWPIFRNLLPFWRWLLALRHRIKGDSPVFIVERVLGLRPIEDANTDFKGVRDYLASYRSYDDSGEAMLEFSCGISGVTDEFVEKKANEGLGAMGAEVCKVEHLGPGHWLLHFWKTEPKNLLDDAIEIKASDLSDWDGKTVVYGLTEAGEPAKLSYSQTSGIVVGGVPGAGKSAGATLLTLPLLASSKASVAIFDGKGGMDWAWAQRAASLYNNDCDLDLETATDQLEQLAQRCVEDLKSHPWSESDPDFWHSGASALHPFHLVVIDECQTLFDTTGRSKEDKALVERCKRAVATIVRKGRSAGWCVMLLTQKPTADSIPTSIRDNCVVRFALRVTTREASEAVLGAIPDGDPTPTEIPSTRRGGAVVQGEDGHTVAVRFFYLPVTEAAKSLDSSTLQTVSDGLTV
ncbi:zonular occludens toxin domain-containing protein [Bifidobacterium pseudocatenulatum]|uniref:zonular occludens toxin domain-containing protein n=1 Tax=Bifidobacterium pseudocatenulatum TaxID=28026 RepID=UPI0022E36110|nr:zonular occludens toxin domain-containing protein [Bifidobacterium pseudocatenulatum]